MRTSNTKVKDFKKKDWVESFISYARDNLAASQTPELVTVLGEDIQEQLISFLNESMKTSPVLSQWFQANTQQVVDAELKEKMLKQENREKESKSIRREELELIMLRAQKRITDDEWEALRTMLEERKQSLRKLDEPENQHILQRVREVVSLSEMCTTIMNKGLAQEKREFLSQICSNLVLTEKKVAITMLPEVQAFVDGLQRAKEENPLFEPNNILDISDQNPIFVSVRKTLLPR